MQVWSAPFQVQKPSFDRLRTPYDQSAANVMLQMQDDAHYSLPLYGTNAVAHSTLRYPVPSTINASCITNTLLRTETMSTQTQPDRPPRLPPGLPTAFDGITETLSFHSSPETFIASRILAFEVEHAAADSHAPVRAKILNRNVVVISSHAQIIHVLSSAEHEDEAGAEPGFVATEAYKQFMAPFYPSPNLLLSDGAAHSRMRMPWERRVGNLGPRTQQLVKETTGRHFDRLVDSEVDLYESLKSLAWRILLGLFLKLDEADAEFKEIEKLQEDLLRGQFSLFPVSVNVGVWKSPRSKGTTAKEKLQRLILARLKNVEGACPLYTQSPQGADGDLDEVANHVLLFTSSLAVKATASLLTAYLLNLFLLERRGVRLVEEILALQGQERVELMRSIELETERLSPPIVGVMRRVSRESVVPSASHGGQDLLIPGSWDAWLYFVRGGRDPSAFGETSGRFVPDRFLPSSNPGAPQGLAFSAGAKRCLGQSLVREICLAVAESMLEGKTRLLGEVQATGVRCWLGWQESEGVGMEEWARDMKQLPTQRPARPVMVTVRRGGDEKYDGG